MDVAVLIVTYRSAQLTIAAIRSLAGERTAPGYRIRAVVVDNASGDFGAIVAAVRSNEWSSWVSVILAPRNGGFAYGNNLAIREALRAGRPDYLYLLNPDAQVRPGAIAGLVAFLEAHPGVGIVGSGIENDDGTDWPIAFRFPSLLSEINDGLAFGIISRLLRPWTVARQMSGTPAPVDWVSGASMMVRTSVLDAIGGMDENYFLYFEETDFCRRAKLAGFATWYVPQSRVMHMRGKSTNLSMVEARPKRLPDYWFESRRRYFVLNFGIRYAVLTDAIALTAHALGGLKRLILRQTDRAIPNFLPDLYRSSTLRRKNRTLPPRQTSISPSCRI
ncbi:MAG TPA: glycosyltransferase family 2 protein [Steroidobacteraceae bacterium]|nr:glycosyltransferase family 2 protein [Steroidobacteraceae bacterium]